MRGALEATSEKLHYVPEKSFALKCGNEGNNFLFPFSGDLSDPTNWQQLGGKMFLLDVVITALISRQGK